MCNCTLKAMRIVLAIDFRYNLQKNYIYYLKKGKKKVTYGTLAVTYGTRSFQFLREYEFIKLRFFLQAYYYM